MKLRSVLLSWDTASAVVASIALFFLCPKTLPARIASNILSLSVQVLSILFSLFFAAFAVIAASTADKFIQFLEKDNGYSWLLWSLKISVGSLFLALAVSLISFFLVELHQGNSGNPLSLSRLYIIIPSAFFAYSLVAAFQCFLDSLKFSKRRVEHLGLTQDNHGDKGRDNCREE